MADNPVTTNVPLPEFTAAGLVVPTEPQILQGVFADYVAAFAATGRALNTELTTPQGQLAQSQAYMLAQLNAGWLRMIANTDPATAEGEYQDALGRIYFLTRQPATFATVEATLSGIAGATIPAGALVRSADGALWASTGAVRLNAAGTGLATFRAQQVGSAPTAGPNGLRIYQQLPGWEGVYNATGSTSGRDVENRQSFEQRRAESVNIGGTGTAESVRAAVAAVPGVTDAYVYNNGSSVPIDYGATLYPIPAHSIALVAAGGDDTAVAEAIFSKLDAGCGLPNAAGAGTLTEVTITDSVNYAPPYPAYVIRYVRPLPVTVHFRIEIVELPNLPSTFVADVQRAVSNAVTSGFVTSDGSVEVARARIGSQIVGAEYAAAILAIQNITPVSIYIGMTPNPTSGASVLLGIDQVPVCPPSAITVVSVPLS